MSDEEKLVMDEDEKDADYRIYRILIVDDEQEVLDALRLMLERAGQFKSRVSVANSGEAGLSEMRKHRFDLVLSDYKMPGMNGAEFLGKVRKMYPKTIRMLITGYSDVNIAKDAINKARIHNYIEKPWDSEYVRSTIYAALKEKTEGESEKISISADPLSRLRESMRGM